MKQSIKTMLALVAGAMALSACSEEALEELTVSEPLPVKGNVSFTATLADDEGTRASIGKSNTIVWNEGDEISVISYGVNNKCTLASGVGSAQGSFIGTCETGTDIYAIYPYNANHTLTAYDAEKISDFVIAWNGADQTAVLGSFPLNTPMVAVAPNVEQGATTIPLAFQNVCALVKFTTDHTCKKVVFKAKGTDDKLVSEKLIVDYDANNKPRIYQKSGPSNTVTLTGKDGANLVAGTYYIAVMPGSLANGFELTFTDKYEEKTYTKSTTKSVTLKRNTVLNLGNITLRGTEVETLKGEGTEANPYEIYDMDDLITMQRWVNSGSKKDKEYELKNDIDGEGRELTPIGSASNSFSGRFSGNNHTLSNIHLGQTPLITKLQDNEHDGFKPLYYAYVSGLFGFITDAEIKDLTISNFTMYENKYLPSDHSEFANEHTMVKSLLVGAARGYSNSSSLIKNITIEANQTIKLDDAPEERPLVVYGGIVGASLCNLWIEDCTNYCNVAGTTYRSAFYGSILGFALGGQEYSEDLEFGSFVSINKCRNFGNMTMGMVSNIQYHSCFMGGILGHALNFNFDDDVAVQIVNCVNFGNLSAWKSAAAQDNAIGGIAGTMNTDGLSDKDIAITNCINNGTINSTCYGGGIFGRGSADGDVSSGKGDIMIQYCATTNAITASDRSDGNDFIGYYKDKAYYNNVKVFSNTATESVVTATECRDFMNQKLEESGAIETGYIYKWKLYDKDNTKLDLEF